MDSETKGIRELAKAQGYEVKGVKSFLGREGYGFNATMYREGKKIAFVMDSADGGMYDWEWVDRKEEAILEMNVATLPEQPSGIEGADWTLKIDMDWFISGLVEDFENDKTFRTKCKTKTLFSLHSHQNGEYIIHSAPYTASVKTRIEAEYGKDLKEIINERFMKPLSEKDSDDLYYRPKCRTKTYFRLTNGKMMVNRQPYSIALGNRIRSEYGDKLLEILNERY
tara:strand:- start:1136 stop:1810 length:675 start_codon:yes stop_codon:yes gene_type:complete